MRRGVVQLVVLYAGFRIILNDFRNKRASFRAKAGPVEYETSQAATVLRDVLKAIQDKIKLVLANVSDYADGTSVAVFDSVIESSYAMATRDQWWVR